MEQPSLETMKTFIGEIKGNKIPIRRKLAYIDIMLFTLSNMTHQYLYKLENDLNKYKEELTNEIERIIRETRV